MAYDKPVIKSKLHGANKVVNNGMMSAMNNSEQARQLAEETRLKIEAQQEEIDLYNSKCGEKDAFFDSFQLTGKDVIVKLHKENFIKGVTELTEGVPMYDAWVSQVDGRMNQTQAAKWVDNPLPYVFTGVVVSISPLVWLDYFRTRDQINSLLGLDNPLTRLNKVLEIGDIVHLAHFMFADTRFYKDKQQRDFIKNPLDYRIEFWEGYVKISYNLIEGIALDKEAFLKQTSPYMQYKEHVKQRNLNNIN